MKIEIDWKKIRSRPPYTCGKCKRKATLNKKCDAYFCRPCNRWTETKCSDKECEFCTKRPKLPIMRATPASTRANDQ